jgi:hypothetical protein
VLKNSIVEKTFGTNHYKFQTRKRIKKLKRKKKIKNLKKFKFEKD